METIKANRPHAIAWLFTLVVVLALSFSNGALSRLDAALSDLFYFNKQPPADVVLVDIDERSLGALGPWPWHRELLAELGTRIAEKGARQQLWDLILSEARDGDSVLQRTFDAYPIHPGIVPVIEAGSDATNGFASIGGQYSENPELCGEGSPFPRTNSGLGVAPSLGQRPAGHLTPVFDPDGRLRKFPAIICNGQTPIPALALMGLWNGTGKAAWVADGYPGRPSYWLQTPAGRLPLDAQGNFHLTFATPISAYPTIPAHLFFGGAVPENMLRGKTVILGVSAIGLGARVATTLSPATPGMLVHAELYSRIQQNTVAAPVGMAYPLAVVLLAALGIIWVRCPGIVRFGLPASFALTFLLAVALLNSGYLVSLAAVLLWHALYTPAHLLARLWQERSARQASQRQLASLVPPALLAQLDAAAPQDIVAARRQRFGLVHARLRNLGQFAHHHHPEAVLALLHALNAAAQRVAVQYGAQIYPAQQDQFLMVWPDINPEKDGRAMLEAARQWHGLATSILAQLPANPPLAMEVAVHVDDALSGFVGSRERRRPVLYGRLLQVTDALLGMSEEFASPLLLTGALGLDVSISPGLRALGEFRLPDLPGAYVLLACAHASDAPAVED